MYKNILIISSLIFSLKIWADDFSKKDVDRWEKEFTYAAQEGRKMWTNDGKVKLGTNGVACAQCHPNASNVHPETYPKFQKQIGKVVYLTTMVNWCIRNPLEGKSLEVESDAMNFLLAYIYSERKGVKLAPGKH